MVLCAMPFPHLSFLITGTKLFVCSSVALPVASPILPPAISISVSLIDLRLCRGLDARSIYGQAPATATASGSATATGWKSHLLRFVANFNIIFGNLTTCPLAPAPHFPPLCAHLTTPFRVSRLILWCLRTVDVFIAVALVVVDVVVVAPLLLLLFIL